MPRLEVLSLPERLDVHPAYTGRGVCIAFVDLGFYAHPDLLYPEKRIRTFGDVTREAPLADDLFEAAPTAWHGTMTACAAAGSGYLSGGRFRGIASGADVVLVKAGTDAHVRGKHVASAIRFPLRHPELGIRILNVSLGVSADDPDVRDVERAVREVVAAGVVVFAAAGNDPTSPPEPPGSTLEAITVGGEDDRNTRDGSDDATWHSSTGFAKPDLLAPALFLPAPMLPGTRVAREARASLELLSVIEELTADRRFGRPPSDPDPTLDALAEALEARLARQKTISPDYQHVDGTSFASPIVASVAAQMLEANPNLRPADVRRGLVSTAAPLDGVPRSVQGAGVVRPREAVEWALAEIGHAR